MPAEIKANTRKTTTSPSRPLPAVTAARLIIVISCIMLYFSGLGQMPIYRRYNVVNLPGLSWADQYLITLQLHYLFSAILIGALLFVIIYRYMLVQGKKTPSAGGDTAPPSFFKAGDKQDGLWLRSARLLITFNLALLILSGLVKVYKNLPGVELNYTLLVTVTALHNLATVLLLCGAVLYLVGKIIARINKTPGSMAG